MASSGLLPSSCTIASVTLPAALTGACLLVFSFWQEANNTAAANNNFELSFIRYLFKFFNKGYYIINRQSYPGRLGKMSQKYNKSVQGLYRLARSEHKRLG